MNKVNDCGKRSGLETSRRAPPDEMFRTVQSTPPPPLKARVPCLSTLCLGAVLFSIIAEFQISSKTTYSVSTSGLRVIESNERRIWPGVYVSLATRAGCHWLAHSIAKALEAIATGLLSVAPRSVTRPKLIVRPRRTSRASANTSDWEMARMKCVV